MKTIIKLNNNRLQAKHLPVLIMGVIGVMGILTSLAINEPQFSLQMQSDCLVSPGQVVSYMLQAALY